MKDPCPVALRGIIPALNTPFDSDNRIDLKAVARRVEFLVEAGCVGVLVPAVAAEVGSLEPDERRAIVDTVLDVAGERLSGIVGLKNYIRM